MNVMVIGSGGREHAIVKSLKKSSRIDTLYVLPGNGGMAKEAVCVPEIGAKDLNGMVAFAKSHDIGFAVIAPDDPLVLGAVDALEAVGVQCFGPNKAAARIEGSKAFAKDLMEKYGIPTAKYKTFTDINEALDYVQAVPTPIVIKADGLALGKGVIIAQSRQEAQNAIHSMMEDKIFGASGNRVVIEEFLTGPEVSVLAFTDGKTMRPMVSSMDHKRALDADQGLNTGGMGTVAPNPYYTPQIAQTCMETIFVPTMKAMNAEGCPFKGCLYFGLMLTPDGPKVIEYNCRFGDPETQVVLPLLESDLFEVMQAVADERLDQVEVRFKDEYACCVVMASKGYPQKYQTGFPITMDEGMTAQIFVAGAKLEGDTLKTSGGRVLGVTATGSTLEQAIDRAYENAARVHFENAYCRRDIGARAMQANRR